MEKKTNFRPNFGFVWPKVRPLIFFQGFYLLLMLDIVVSYQYMQYQEKLMIQIQENCKKPQFGPDLGLLDPKSGRGFFFFQKSNFVSTISEKSNHPILRKLSDERSDRGARKISQNADRITSSEHVEIILRLKLFT